MTATWNGFGSATETTLAKASSSGTIWTLNIAAMMNLVVSLGMVELVSAYPNSGGQYCWAFCAARPNWPPFASYMSACGKTCGWWLGLASVCNLAAVMVLAMLHLGVDGYIVRPW
ncbi:hypothetical protein BDV38DRAFT_61464 [Aspergillus pseudotamarii]|uniref:Amino acid permease/ SLC12A domain-containing protein n=1 Tax=Aspergillus pseudotamarii TaxID=132259 RepID=A0A5N6SY68_ASPPS|nr:uncharacterized protein BDV38DRAFT_61464 [Aspergillus pseudotamarii]KAE8138857.1 hypothetical protein BDV38DRAFT_61464 [Aspergillus pseudotamarii]